MKDSDKPHNVKIAIRGDVSNPGEEAPRQFLAVLQRRRAEAFSNGSGRMELANAIASTKNPLTARVMVNRIWAEHFGEGNRSIYSATLASWESARAILSYSTIWQLGLSNRDGL